MTVLSTENHISRLLFTASQTGYSMCRQNWNCSCRQVWKTLLVAFKFRLPLFNYFRPPFFVINWRVMSIHSCNICCLAIFFSFKINKNHRTYNSLFCLILLVIVYLQSKFVCSLCVNFTTVFMKCCPQFLGAHPDSYWHCLYSPGHNMVVM